MITLECVAEDDMMLWYPIARKWLPSTELLITNLVPYFTHSGKGLKILVNRLFYLEIKVKK